MLRSSDRQIVVLYSGDGVRYGSVLIYLPLPCDQPITSSIPLSHTDLVSCSHGCSVIEQQNLV